MMSFLIEMAWKSLVCAGLVLLALQLMRRRSAAERAFVAHLGLLALLLLPIATTSLPDLGVAPPPAVARTYAAIAPAMEEVAPAASRASLPAAAESTVAEWSASDMLLAAYAVPAVLLMLMTLLGLARLHRLRERAEVLVDPLWLTALAAAQRRLGLKHGTALLTSDEVDSPVSWGVVRPIIVIDRDAARRADQAEAIIAHELAHVARLDWPAMLLGRTVAALFWFNPLVRLLARAAHEYSEQAADDFVLRSDVPSADYAEVLVGAARHCAGRGLVANGVAPARGSLARRVGNILDPRRSRLPVRLRWSAACLAGALSLGTALAAVSPAIAPEVHAVAAEPGAGDRAAAELAAIPTPQTQAIPGHPGPGLEPSARQGRHAVQRVRSRRAAASRARRSQPGDSPDRGLGPLRAAARRRRARAGPAPRRPFGRRQGRGRPRARRSRRGPPQRRDRRLAARSRSLRPAQRRACARRSPGSGDPPGARGRARGSGPQRSRQGRLGASPGRRRGSGAPALRRRLSRGLAALLQPIPGSIVMYCVIARLAPLGLALAAAALVPPVALAQTAPPAAPASVPELTAEQWREE